MQQKQKRLTLRPDKELVDGYVCSCCGGAMAFSVVVSWVGPGHDVKVAVHAECEKCYNLRVDMELDVAPGAEYMGADVDPRMDLLDTILRARDLCDASTQASGLLRRLVAEGPFIDDDDSHGIDLWFRAEDGR